jgi:hypothetical protein
MVLRGSYRTEHFTHHGQQWTQYLCNFKPEMIYVMGVDLAMTMDYTAIAILRYSRAPLPIEEAIVDERASTIKQGIEEHFDVVFAERMEQGIGFPAVIAHVRELLDRPPLRDDPTCLVVDETGVGAPVCDEFEDAGLKPVRVHITSGTDVTKLEGRNRFGVPKGILTGLLDAKLHTDELKIAAGLPIAPAIAEELKDLQRHVTAAGHARYEARVGKSDDLVFAIAMALWWCAERRKYWSTVGPLRGLC